MNDSTAISLKTPQHNSQLNPFLCEPLTPRNARLAKDLYRQVLASIHHLSPPSLLVPTHKAVTISPLGGRSSEFKEALKRMRNGSALHRLQQEQDLDSARHIEAIDRLNRISSNECTEKGLSNPAVQVQLGRQAPERRMSGIARSA